MSFYYNYTGQYPGSINVDRANHSYPADYQQACAGAKAAPEEPISPWLAAPPKAEASQQQKNDHLVYYPHYEQPKPANPWLAEPPKPLQPAQPVPSYQPQAPFYYAGQPVPEPTRIWYGSTKAEVDAQNSALAPSVGAYKPMTLVPVNMSPGQQAYCRELDGKHPSRGIQSAPGSVPIPKMPGITYTQHPLVLPSYPRGSHLVTSDITSQLSEPLKSVKAGLLHLFLQHTSCALSLNENWDSDVREDMTDSLDKIVVEDKAGKGIYRHDAEGSDDMPAHIKSSLIGASVSIPITNGKLALGTWQGIWFLEFRDGKHRRKVLATVQGET
ncbi:MAG: hypothetical protein Q9170_000580 [Blastenia crenularia]